ncbi:hypothetical protein JCM31598_15130 [Desulfonatronum parangueonense]
MAFRRKSESSAGKSALEYVLISYENFKSDCSDHAVQSWQNTDQTMLNKFSMPSRAETHGLSAWINIDRLHSMLSMFASE